LEKELQKQPLGVWINKSHQMWKWEYAEENKEYLKNGNSFYCKEGGTYVQCELTNIEDVNFTHYVDVNIDKKNCPYVIAAMEKKSLYEQISDNNGLDRLDVDDEYACYRKDWGQVEYLVNDDVLTRHLEKGECIIATDGSNKNDEGAQAWLVANNEGRILARGRGRVPYQKSDASSLRPELAALLAVTTFLNHYVFKHQVQFEKDKKINIYTDSKNAITDLEGSLYPSTKNALENNIDLKLEIKTRILRKSPIQFCLVHVLAHQNERRPYDELPLPAQLNCQVDEYAGGVYEDAECGEAQEEVEFYRAQICSLSLPFIRPTTNIKEQLIAFANGHASEEQLARYWGIKHEWLCNIEWEGFKTALRRLRNEKKGPMCKLVHKQLPTMSIMKRNGMGMTTKCPLCLKEDENWNHVFQCTSNVARVEREIQLAILKKGLIKKNTNPVLMRRILAIITQWVKGYKITFPKADGGLKKVNEACIDQCNLKVENMFAGVVSHKLGDIQDEYYKNVQMNKQRYNKYEWNATFIKLLLTFGTAIWQHRCEYLHNESLLSNEKQVRALAWKMRTNINENPWKLRMEDKHLMRRKKDFFLKSSIRNLNGWLERVLLSIQLHEDNDLATRQDIRKWIILPREGYNKKIQYPKPIVKKKYRQLKFQDTWRIGGNSTCHTGMPNQILQTGKPFEESEVLQRKENLRVLDNQHQNGVNEEVEWEQTLENQNENFLDKALMDETGVPVIRNWFKRI